MKNLTKVLAIASIFIAGSTASFAQATATASASATIITPITIAKTVDMNFGNVAVSATVAETATLPKFISTVLAIVIGVMMVAEAEAVAVAWAKEAVEPAMKIEAIASTLVKFFILFVF